MCVPVKTGSELVQKCLAAQAKFSVDNQNKRFLPWQDIRPTWQQWQHQTWYPDHTGSATLLGQSGHSWHWDKPHPGRQKDQIQPNLLLADTPARLTCPVCHARRLTLTVPAALSGWYQSLLAVTDPAVLLLRTAWLPRKCPALPLPAAGPPACMSDHTHASDLSANHTSACLVHSTCFSFIFFSRNSVVVRSVAVDG